MKKVLLMLLLFVGSVAASLAQQMREIVYLKNGSVVRGIVIEQVPGVSLKIQTSDGSIFAYQMSDVEKITKEMVGNNRNSFNNNSSFSNNGGFLINDQSGSQQGYKGFLDFGYTVGVGDFEEDRIEFSTSHGYQFNPHFYAGIGVGLSYFTDAEVLGVPIFAHIRANLLDKAISPYVDFRIGYSPTEDVKGFYMAPSIGCKINSFNISLGYVMQKAPVYYYGYSGGYYGYYYEESSENLGGFNFKVGFEF